MASPSASFGGINLPLPTLSVPEATAILDGGEIDVLGRMPWSSNGTYLVLVAADGIELPAIYKPRRGERPLWDFPTGTLCQREVAAYELSRALDWGIVPETVLRDGPAGPGAMQRFVAHDPQEHYFSLLEQRPDDFRPFAAFDVMANNADRKGGHCLRSLADDRIRGIDHGLTFHPQWKLRTVIWDFAGETIASDLLGDIARIDDELTHGGPLADHLEPLLSMQEMGALSLRVRAVLDDPELPAPDPYDHCYPWPLV